LGVKPQEYPELQADKRSTDFETWDRICKLDGWPQTFVGRRRYIPELTSGNRRLQALGERQALSAPIQGSASDVFKLAMIGVDAGAHRTTGPRLPHAVDGPRRCRLRGA
jgi:hypothetical protein